jgi:hypothetical protein
MSASGHINIITNPAGFFAAVLVGEKPPANTFQPAKMAGFSVRMTGLFDLFPITMPGSFNPADASFTIPDLPPALLPLGLLDDIWINVDLHGSPFYRTGLFPRQNLNKDLEIFVFQPVLKEGAGAKGITAGLISQALTGMGLPSSTMLSADPMGVGLVADRSGADIDVRIAPVPDISPNLSLFFDMVLRSWDITVGFPASCVTTADGVLNRIRTALQDSESSANQLVSNAIAAAVEMPPLSIPPGSVGLLKSLVSIQFVSLAVHTVAPWHLTNTIDSTLVVVPSLTIGFPQFF